VVIPAESMTFSLSDLKSSSSIGGLKAELFAPEGLYLDRRFTANNPG
jgi:hypothetical protein